MAKKYEDLVPGRVWQGDVCCVDDPVTGQPKHVAIEEPTEEQQHITVAELATRPEVVWDQDKNHFVYKGSETSELSAEADGQEN